MRGKHISPPAPFRKVTTRSRWEGTTQTAGVNPASPVTPQSCPSPFGGGLGGGSVSARGKLRRSGDYGVGVGVGLLPLSSTGGVPAARAQPAASVPFRAH